MYEIYWTRTVKDAGLELEGNSMDIIEKIEVNDSRFFIEKAKKEYLRQIYGLGIKKGEEIHYEVYDNATILPIKKSDKSGYAREGGVIDCNGNYIAISSVDERSYGGYQSECFQIHDKTVVYCGTDRAMWGHFLVNTVPRLWIALRQDELIDEYVIVRDLDSGRLSLSENQKEFLQLLGIYDKIRIIDAPKKYKKVIVPEAAYRRKTVICGGAKLGEYYNEFLQTYDFVVNRALEKAKASSAHMQWGEKKKVFFSRSGSGLSQDSSREPGIEVIDSFFRNNGYDIIWPEKISLTEMIYYLHHCDSIAYISGTLQHNMLFAPSGCKTIAIERRLILPRYQTDIDIIKKIVATYVSGQLSFIPMRNYLTAVYAYTHFMKEYQEREDLMLPDIKYLDNSFRVETMKSFLRNFMWDEGAIGEIFTPRNSYCLDALLEDIDEMSLSEDGIDEPLNLSSPEYWKHRLFTLLVQYNVPYWRWNEGNQRVLARTFSGIIERNIDLGKREFLIFPFGVNGMLFEQILRQRYGISPLAVFDNHLAKYNQDIKELKEIDKYRTDNSCVVLTTLIPECRQELEKYFDLYLIESPFSVW